MKVYHVVSARKYPKVGLPDIHKVSLGSIDNFKKFRQCFDMPVLERLCKEIGEKICGMIVYLYTLSKVSIF